MKKGIFLLFLIVLCNGCFLTKTKTLNCDLSTNIGEVTIKSSYTFTYKKDKIDKLSLNMKMTGDKSVSDKIYQKYVNEYQNLNGGDNSLTVNFDDSERIINLTFDINPKNDNILKQLNLSFVKDASFEDLKKDLSKTEYSCR